MVGPWRRHVGPVRPSVAHMMVVVGRPRLGPVLRSVRAVVVALRRPLRLVVIPGLRRPLRLSVMIALRALRTLRALVVAAVAGTVAMLVVVAARGRACLVLFGPVVTVVAPASFNAGGAQCSAEEQDGDCAVYLLHGRGFLVVSILIRCRAGKKV